MARKNEIMEQLKADLGFLLPTFVLTDGTSSGNPTLVVSADATPATTESVAFIRILQRDYVGYPTISLAATDDGRNLVLQLVLEENAAAAGVGAWSAANFGLLMKAILDRAVEVELYMNTVGDDPELADITGANLRTVIPVSARVKNMGN